MTHQPSRSPTQASSTPEDGWLQLSRGQWHSARAAFTSALTVEETPEALEGLSWAAWWLDDAAVVFESRERAFRLYSQRHQPAHAARMATWLAADQLDFHGAAAIANGWLQRAKRLLESVPEGPDHGWLAFHEGYIVLASGDAASSRRLSVRAAALGRQFGVPDLEMLGLALEGTGLVGAAMVKEGMACLDEAAATAIGSEPAIPISRAWTCCLLVSACEAVRDYPRAYQWCDRIAEFAERYGSAYMLGFCRVHYGMLHMSRGRWSDAETMLEGAVEAYTTSRPASVPGVLRALAELRRRQGRAAEAERLLDQAGGSEGQLCRGRLALDQGAPYRARTIAERLLRQAPLDQRLARAPALELLIEALTGEAELERTTAALDELRELAEVVGTAPLLAAVDLAKGRIAAARGDHERARQRLEDAVDRFDRCAAPFEAAQARLALATSQLALGRNDAARDEAARALDSLLQLGAATDAGRARRLLEAAAQEGPSSPLPGILTPREREVLGRVAEGLTNRQIAERLAVSEHTIHRHVTSILRKLDLPSRTAAAAFAIRSGLLNQP